MAPRSTKKAKVSADFLTDLVESDVDRFVSFLSGSDLEDGDLSLAAELAALVKPKKKVSKTLIALVSHTNPVVREGALYGLDTGKLTSDEHRALQSVRDTDEREFLRELAGSILAKRS